MAGESREIDVEKALIKLGVYGRYQMTGFLLSTGVWMFCGMQMMTMPFVNTVPPFNCFQNISGHNWTSEYVGHCKLATNDSKVFQCMADGYEPVYKKEYGKTIASEWDLICDDQHYNELASSFFMFGLSVGSLFIPSLADKFGRKWVLIVTTLMTGVFSAISALVPIYSAYIAMRMITGTVYGGASIVGWVLSCEVVAPQLRAYATTGMGVWWTVGYVLDGPIAYYVRDWRPFLLTVSAPTLLVIAYIWLCPESPHWLLATKRAERLEAWVAEAGRWNGVRVGVEEVWAEEADVHRGKAPARNILHIFTHPLMLIQTLMMVYLWFCNVFVYYGLSLVSTQLAGGRYLNFILSGLVELPAYLVAPPLMNTRLGRKWTMVIFHIVAGVSLLALIGIPQTTSSGVNLVPLLTTVWLVGKFSITLTFGVVFMYGAEIYPTTIRTAGVGVCNVASRIAGVVAPYVRQIALIDAMLPSILFGILSMVAAVVTLGLPETNNRKLPEDLEDIEPGPCLRWCGFKAVHHTRYVPVILVDSEKQMNNVKRNGVEASNESIRNGPALDKLLHPNQEQIRTNSDAQF